MKSLRHHAREVALQVLYRYDVAQQTTGAQPPEGSALASDLLHHFEHFQVPLNVREFAAQLVAGTLNQVPTIDPLIEDHAQNWKISRMSCVDRSLLRMATYEILHFPEIPYPVTMDEAIELGKQFGTADTPSFINGILDAIGQMHSTKKQEPAS